jgi:hypothetical protein
MFDLSDYFFLVGYNKLNIDFFYFYLKVVMFKIIISAAFSLVPLYYSYALDCHVAASLNYKQCSSSTYFTANSTASLNDYLNNGKFGVDGKLLNLAISFNMNNQNILIATPCKLKLVTGISLKSNAKGICLKASHLSSSSNSLIVANDAPINITAGNSVNLVRSTLDSQGEINISTLHFQPIDGGIFVSVDSRIKAKKILLNSKSALYLHLLLNLSSPIISLNGAIKS